MGLNLNQFSEDQQAFIRQWSLEQARVPLSTQPVLSSWAAVVDYLHLVLAHSSIELFHVLYLDRQNRLIADETLSKGTVDHCPVYPREIAKQALHHDATAMIIAHNHPSGNSKPSSSDISMTRQVQDALNTIGVTLHDHIIIGHSNEYSFRASGDLS